jgi:hypothetical protein
VEKEKVEQRKWLEMLGMARDRERKRERKVAQGMRGYGEKQARTTEALFHA